MKIPKKRLLLILILLVVMAIFKFYGHHSPFHSHDSNDDLHKEQNMEN